jgi:hypothetical protein
MTWCGAATLYTEYFQKPVARFTEPCGMLANSIYKDHEYLQRRKGGRGCTRDGFREQVRPGMSSMTFAPDFAADDFAWLAGASGLVGWFFIPGMPAMPPIPDAAAFIRLSESIGKLPEVTARPVKLKPDRIWMRPTSRSPAISIASAGTVNFAGLFTTKSSRCGSTWNHPGVTLKPDRYADVVFSEWYRARGVPGDLAGAEPVKSS